MRLYSNEAIETADENVKKLFVKLGNYAPDEKLDRDDIRNLMFILEDYQIELHRIKREREKQARQNKKTR